MFQKLHSSSCLPAGRRLTLNPCSGQTLIEVLIAISIGIIIITSMTIAVTSALSNGTYSKNQTIATQYAQEGIELVRNQKFSAYQTFSSLSGRYCLAQACSAITTGAGNCGPNSGGSNVNCSSNINSNLFIRQVDILPSGFAQSKCSNSIQATVSVLWTDGKCQSGVYCHSVNVVSCFSDANIIQAP